MSISIVYEDSNLVVVNKPAGLITHPKNETDKSFSVSNWVLEHYPKVRGVGEYSDRPGIMHRLDKDTSGLLIIAKNQASYDYFKKLFQSRAIKKHYTALVVGHLKMNHGVIDAPIGRIGMKRTTLLHNGKLKDKKSAVTEYHVVKKFKNYTLLDITPKTGRTHQIRVHMKHTGYPIAGDQIYGSQNTSMPQWLTRLFLHAQRLEFTTPDGKALSLEADLPEDLQKVVSALQ